MDKELIAALTGRLRTSLASDLKAFEFKGFKEN
jgi:hypothetical protein